MKSTENANLGIVYCLTNPAMPGLVKIGMTSRNNLNERMKELYDTGVPMPFECVYACYTPKYEALEKAIHNMLADCRINNNREFFRIHPDRVIPLLQLEDTKDATEEVNNEINNDLTPSDRESVAREKMSKRPRVDFFELGLKVGDIIHWVGDSSITASIYSNRTVLYNGEEIFLSKLTCDLHKELKGSKTNCIHVAPCPEWKYNDVLLQELYDNIYPVSE